MGHIDGTGSNFALYITTDASTNAIVRVSIPGGTYTNLVVVPSNQVVVVTLPSAQTYMNCTDCIRNQGVKIESLNHDIVVYAHIYSNARSDATLLIPVETLGKEYYAIAFTQSPSSGTQRSEFMLVGVEDSTFIDIYPTVDVLPNKPKDTKYTVMLNTGEVYHAQSLTDVTGTRIVARSADGIACKKVAAFSGSSFTRVGCANATTGDNLYQQLFPTTSWGQEFVTAPLKSRNGDQFRVLAKYDSTRLVINGGTPIYLDEGEHHSFVSYEANYIVTDKPVTLAQYPRTQNCDGNTGDPTLIVIPPIEQMVKYVAMYSSPYQNITGQYLNIITRTTDTAKFRLDGQKIVFTAMSNKPQFAYAQQTVSSGIHRMNSDSFFQVVSYGFGNVEAYGYAGGTNIKNLVQSITASKDSMCLGDTLSLRAEVNYIPTSMTWYFGDGRTDTSNLTPKIVYANPGLYTISLVTRKEGLVDCGSTDSTIYKVRVHGYPSASFSVSGTCLKDTFRFTDQSVSNTPFSYVSKWSWTFGDSTTSVVQNLNKYFNRVDSFPVKLVVWNNNLCKDSVYGAHFVNPHPQINYLKTDSCPGLPVPFTDISSISQGANVQWNWLFDSLEYKSGKNVTYSTLDEGMHYFDLHVQSDSGCNTFARDSFFIHPKPSAKFFASSHCYGNALNVIDSSLLGLDYFWTLGDTSFTGPVQPYIFKDTGVYELSLEIVSDKGCVDSTRRNVSVYPIPLSTWQSSGNCQEDIFRFEPDFDTIRYASWDYFWQIDGANYTGPSQQRAFTPGLKQVSLSVISSELCGSSFSGEVYVNPNPISAPVYTPNCERQPGTLIDQSDYVGSSTRFREWTWGNGKFSDSIRYIVPTGLGPLTAQLLVRTDSACSNLATVNLSILPLPRADFVASGVCPRAPVQLKDQSQINPGDPIVSFDWKVSEGSTGSLDTMSFTPLSGGTFSIREIVISLAGCRDTVQKTWHVLDYPVVEVEETSSCVEFEAALEDISTLNEHNINGWDWVWNGTSYSGKRITETFVDSGYYVYTLNVSTDEGCVFNNVIRDSLFISPRPYASFVFSPEFALLNQPEFTFKSTSIGASQTLWSFGDGGQSILTNPEHAYADTGHYGVKLIVMNQYGCSDSAFDSLWVRPMLVCLVPTAFTPNGDYLNDAFGPVCDGLLGFEMKIFNRWGQEVFHSEDGRMWEPFNEKEVRYPDGIYLYHIIAYDYKGHMKQYGGSVVLIR
ncbi:MAG: PKD domain-containing protein [Bacteroidota bacterium]|nr:PKD domain-containing protein [Bacteroidota bacterium]MDX5429557.1 PKD domain-containing protein [Bacteroidota bacterium]MDX5468344.1 PKD domain-containing protein [Bacteroidota bacterium]